MNVTRCQAFVTAIVLLPLAESTAQSLYEGMPKFFVHKTQQQGTVRLYRLRLPDGTHRYTTSDAEVLALTRSSRNPASVEPMDAFVYAEPKLGTTRLYRFTQRFPHGRSMSFYTAFEPEMLDVRKNKANQLHSMKAFVFPCDYKPGEIVLRQGRAGTRDVQDVTIYGGPPASESSRGGATFISNNYDEVTLIRFDLSQIPPDATVRNATLELYCNSVGFSQEEIQRKCQLNVFEFRHAWEEGTGTDNRLRHDGGDLATFDGKSEWPTGGVKACGGETLGTFTHEGNYTGWCKWSLDTRVIQEWVSGKRANHGLMIQADPPVKAVCYVSSDASTADNRPTLRLTLSTPEIEYIARDIVPVYCSYHPVSGEHFYSTSEEETTAFIEKAKRDVALNEQQESERKQKLALAKQSEPPASTPAATSPPSGSNADWKVHRIDADASQVFVAITSEVHGRLMDLAVANDKDGILQLMLFGQVFVVAGGTKAPQNNKLPNCYAVSTSTPGLNASWMR